MIADRPIAEEVDQIRGEIERSDRSALESRFERLNAWDAAQLVTRLEKEHQAGLLSLLNPSQAAEVVEELPGDRAAELVSELPAARAADVVEQMESDDGADLLQTLPGPLKEIILQEMEEEERKEARELLSYEPKSAGGIMQKEFISFSSDLRVGDVLDDLRDNAERYSGYPVTYLYVVDRLKKLEGVLQLRSLLFRQADVPVRDVMISDPLRVPVDRDQEEVALMFERYHYLAVPVVDKDDRLVGIVTHDDALQVVQQEASEDLLKFSGIVGGEETHDMPFLRRSGNRLAWLSVNVLLNLLAAAVIWVHEETLVAAIGIAMFLPIISDMSGCSGNQAIAVGIRELATGRITPADFLKVWWAEASVGLLNGLILGAQLGLIAWLLKGSLALAVVVGGALWINTVLSMTIGSLVPLILKRLGRDPALASAPILTTLTDLCGFFLVLSLTAKFLV